MLQLTVDRFRDICPPQNIFVVTNCAYAALVQEQLPALPADQILGEPVGRNTAPCVAYASYRIRQRDPQAVIIVSPADHAVLREEEFRRLIREAVAAATQHEVLITLGIQPSRPDTGYGYIQYFEDANYQLSDTGLQKVKTFTEKPNAEVAQSFVESGDFLWNAGLFIWRAEVIISALQKYSSEIAHLFEGGATSMGSEREAIFIAEAYTQCPSISIDYAVMEKASNVYVLPADIGWSDLGTWDSLHRVGQRDDSNNVVDGDALLYDTQECIIKTPHERLVVVQGLSNYIIAEYDNVLLICERSQEQRVKDFVADVKSRKDAAYY